MKCSNCLKEKDDVIEILKNENFYSCKECMVVYGKDRSGFAFMVGNKVNLKPDYHTMTRDRIFVIKYIFINEECESGRLVYLVDEETERPLKKILDINWLQIIQEHKTEKQ